MYRFPSRFLLVLCVLLCCLALSGRVVLAQAESKQWVEKPTATSPVSNQPRLALILGNTHYGGDNELKNPENDAKAIAKALASLGFSSTVVLDGSINDMSDAIHAFTEKIRAAGSSTIALLYYSGHGVQVGGDNYLIPVGFKMPANDRDMIRHAISAQSALDEMQSANAQINIAILDACRNNPFARDRAIAGKGLAKLETQGVLIAYATAAGATASDNTGGQNGLYTASLLPFLRKPGLSLDSIFRQTRKAVYEASNKKQFPYIYDGLIDADQFYFLPAGSIVPANTVEPIASIPVPPPAHSSDSGPRNPKDSAEIVLIPGGNFAMGDDDQPDNSRRIVNVPAFHIYKNMVTVAMYEKFCEETRHDMPLTAPIFNPGWSKKDHPMVCVSWEDAQAYCKWAGGTLPNEAQWEKAARGTDGYKFPWGNTFDDTKLASRKLSYSNPVGTYPVGSFPQGASPYGVMDMAGNVWQWCADWYNDGRREKHVVRGGAFNYTARNEFRVSNRFGEFTQAAIFNYGFRCVLP